jgi:NTE family protein
VPIEIVQLTFDDVKDPIEREFFLGVPTSFALPAATVSRLQNVAGQLLRDSNQFQEVLLDLRYKAKEYPLSCLDQ